MREAFRRHGRSYARLFARHGIRLHAPARLGDPPASFPFRSPLGRSLAGSLDRLDSKLRRAGGS